MLTICLIWRQSTEFWLSLARITNSTVAQLLNTEWECPRFDPCHSNHIRNKFPCIGLPTLQLQREIRFHFSFYWVGLPTRVLDENGFAKISQIWNFALKVHNNLNFWQKSNIRIFEMKFCFSSWNSEVNIFYHNSTNNR